LGGFQEGVEFNAKAGSARLMRPGTPPVSRPVKTTTKDADLIRDRRERLIRAAIKVFSEKRFHESTVRDIGRRSPHGGRDL
jgi:AcrR family transcriptional regulator